MTRPGDRSVTSSERAIVGANHLAEYMPEDRIEYSADDVMRLVGGWSVRYDGDRYGSGGGRGFETFDEAVAKATSLGFNPDGEWHTAKESTGRFGTYWWPTSFHPDRPLTDYHSGKTLTFVAGRPCVAPDCVRHRKAGDDLCGPHLGAEKRAAQEALDRLRPALVRLSVRPGSITVDGQGMLALPADTLEHLVNAVIE